MEKLFRSVLEQDRAAIVICDTNHIIKYMNKTAIQKYSKRGGKELVGKNLLDCHNEHSQELIKKILGWFMEDENNNMIYTFKNEKENKDVYMVALRDEDNKLIGYYEKHEYRNAEVADAYDFSKSLI